MAAIPLLRSQTSLLNSSKFKLLRPSLNSFIIYNQNPNFSRHFRPIHSITRKSFKGVGSNWEEGSNNQHNQHHQNPNYSRHSLLWEGNESLGHNTTQWQGTYVGSNGEEGSKNKFLVSENKTSENTMKLSGLPEQMVEHNAPVHPITPKSFPESPLIDVNGVCEEPTSEPSPRGWSMFSSPQSTPTNSIKGVGSSGEEGPRIQVNLSSVSENEIYENKLSVSENETSKNTKNWVRIGRQGISESRNTFGTLNSFSASENETSENKFSVSENATSINRMKPSSLPEHNAPVHPITPKSFPESPFINVNGASEEPISEPSHRGWSMFSSPQTTPTNSIKGVGSSGEEGSRIQLNLSPDVSKSVVSMDFVAGGKKGKSKIHWVCAYCGHSTGQWWGTCHSCHKVGTMKQCFVSENETSENMFRVSENEAYETESWVSENKTSDSRMKSSSLPEQMVGHNAPVHPITPKSFPESPLIVVNGASEEPISESSASGWSTFSSPQGNQTNSIKSVGSSGKEGKRIRVNLSPDVAKSVILRDFVAGGKKGKSKIHWVCVDCGHSTTQWWGTCHSCHKVGTMKQFSVSENETSENMMKSSWLPEQMVGQNRPVRLVDVNRGINHMEWRIRLSGLLGLEVNRVLGGGVVPGSLILFGGDPGVGKSTLALQLAALVAVSGDVGGAAPVLYISGEESVEQIGNRADRLSIDTEELFLYSSTDIEDIVEKVRVLSPRVVVVDSIQTMYLKGVAGSPGGMMQVKECTSALLRFAKKTNIPVLLIGHVNKNGEIAGPRVLEHIVDVVLYMEGEKHSSHRLLRSVKNRFGSTDELGVFAMSVSGLDAVSNPSEMFLSEEYSDSQYLPGLAISVIIDGSRSFLVEVQALCVSGPGSTRHINGVQLSRADMILSVLKKQAGLKLEEHSIFLNIISGVTLSETSGDLAVAAAICSSFLEFPLHNRMAFIGEIGLGGELRMVPRIEKRVTTLAKLGYEKCVVPASAGKALEAINPEIEIVACKNLNEVLDKVFRDSD